MNIVCVICSDLLVPSDDVFHTPCGHIFHFVCLTQWLERSKSCPQCREKTTSHRIHRVYFNFSNSDTIVEDASSLQDKIDRMNFQLLLRDKDIKHYTEKCETLEKQNAGLRKEVRKVESEMNEKVTAIHALKDQIKFFKEQCSEVQGTKQEIARLKKKVEEYRNIQTLLDAPGEDVDEMISRTCDPATLITYISVMKREMTISLNKRRELRTKVRSLQQELTKVSMERNFLSEEHVKRKKLEEDLMICESEKMALQNKLSDLQKNPHTVKKSSTFNFKIVDKPSTTSGRKSILEQEIDVPDENVHFVEQSTERKVDRVSEAAGTKVSEKDSPYLPVKSQGVFALKEHSLQRRPTTKLGMSILAKKPRIDQTTTNRAARMESTYDGFGGHSKYDRFPSPLAGPRVRKAKNEVSNTKKLKLDTGDNQKLGDFGINLT